MSLSFIPQQRKVKLVYCHLNPFSRNIDVDLRNLSSLLEDSKVQRVRKRKDWIGLLDKAGLTKLQGSQPDLSYAACTPRSPKCWISSSKITLALKIFGGTRVVSGPLSISF